MTIRARSSGRLGLLSLALVGHSATNRGTKVNRSLTALVVLVVTASCAFGATEEEAARQTVRSLHWIHGPTQVRVGQNAVFNVPNGYVYLEAGDTVKMMAVMENPSDAGETLFGPEDLRWFGVFRYEDTGHIPDDEKIDAGSVLTTIRTSTEEANKLRAARGWGSIHVVGWRYAPFYDPATKRLDWAIDGRSDAGQVVNYNTRILGRTGVTSALLIVDPSQLAQSVAEFKTAVAGYQYLPDQNYQAFKPGDHVAEYGLAALIAGGGAAVAAKTGFWKVLLASLAAAWKLVAAAVLAAFAAIGKLVGRIFGKRS